jgi:hypothetical protein
MTMTLYMISLWSVVSNLVVITFLPVGNEADLSQWVEAGYQGRCPYHPIPPIFLCISAMAVSSVAIS